MIIKSLELENYRNYKTLQIEFDRGVNILYGDNAQGKTNILESIFVSATTKSHKGSNDKDIINFAAEEAHIKTILDKDGLERRVDMHLRKGRSKGIAIDKVRLKKATELLGILNVVFFSPEDLSIIKNSPSERRRFVDMELCQIDSIYLHNLNDYNKIIKQRNRLLKDIFFHPEYRDMIKIWDNQLLVYGKKLIERRAMFVDQLNEIIGDIHKKLSGQKEVLRIAYAPYVKAEDFESRLKQSMERDIKAKATGVGPHKDDFIFYANDIDVRVFGSQGQQRTAALSLKLSEIELVKKIAKNNPVLLLDDVLSELDSNRQNYLLNSIGDIQTIITCTGLDEFVNNRFAYDKVFKVTDGTVAKEN
ncbi:MAG: DNA replication/repair protein RecF [Lachnospiraceae bacterium]|nr:DNA replication/repair protein RecF [Lachnospiraceae bacterium]